MLIFQLLVRLVLLAIAATAVALGWAVEASIAPVTRRELTANWQGQELGVVLQRIADTQNVSLWIDRRVDPQYIVDAQLNAVPLAEGLDQILADDNLGWSAWQDIIYVGPRQSAREMATLLAIARQSLNKLPIANRSMWMSTAPASWPRLTEPRKVLSGWLDQTGITLENPEALDYDLWDARQSLPLPLIDRVTLLLLGFDKTCQISSDGRAMQIAALRRPILITKEYQPGRKMDDFLAAFNKDSTAVVNRRGSHVTLTGRWEDQLHAEQIIDGLNRSRKASTSRPTRNQERRFSLKLQNQPVNKVIDQLASQLGWTVDWHGDASAHREELTSCDIQNATPEELLEGVLSPVGLMASREGTQLTIRTAH